MMKLLLAELRYLATSAGYWVRPYDMHADARVWRWRRTTCRPWLLDGEGTLQRGWWGR